MITIFFILGRMEEHICRAVLLLVVSLQSLGMIILGYGFMVNGGQDGAFMAFLTPFCFTQMYPGFGVLAVIAVLLSKSSTGILMLFFYVIYLVWQKHRTAALALVIIIPIIVLAGDYIGDGEIELFRDNGRLYYWTRALDFIKDRSLWLMGAGGGSYAVYSPAQELVSQNRDEVFIWSHNDWVQIFFELGLVGLSLSVILAFDLVKKIWFAKPEYIASLLLFFVQMCFQMPLHNAPIILAAVSMYNLALFSLNEIPYGNTQLPKS